MWVYVVSLLGLAAPELAVSAQAAPGFGDGGAQFLVKPRLAWEPEALRLHLGAPVVFSADGAHSLTSSEAWGAWVERFEVEHRDLQLTVAALEDVGDSMSVYRLRSRAHPTDLRNGARLTYEAPNFRLDAFSDGIFDVRTVGASASKRFGAVFFTLSGGADPSLTVGPVGAGDLALGVDLPVTEFFRAIVVARGGGLFRDQPVGLGLEGELSLRLGDALTHLELRGTARRVGANYIGNYFDGFYALERDTKADNTLASGYAGRAGVTVRARQWAFDAHVEWGAVPGRGRGEAALRVAEADWQLALRVAQRDDQFRFDENFFASLDGSLRIRGPWFVFSTFSHRREDGAAVREAFAGVGLSQAVL